MVKDTLKSFLTFSKKELNGLLVFALLLLTILLAPMLYSLAHKPETFNYVKFKKEIAEFRASASQQPLHSYFSVKEEVEEKEMAPDYFEFDPNNLDPQLWKRLGLSNRQIAVIKNYENKGGKFYKKEDLKKIYSITKDDYERLETYINIPTPTNSEEYKSRYQANRAADRIVRPALMVELNSADSAQLESLRGIGAAFASRIIKYRTRLGGFYSKEQLKEVYGLDSLKYEQLKDNVRADAALVQKININSASFDDLKRQPYLTYRQMNAIIQYRKQHGPYTSALDLKKVLALSAETIAKIDPYLIY